MRIFVRFCQSQHSHSRILIQVLQLGGWGLMSMHSKLQQRKGCVCASQRSAGICTQLCWNVFLRLLSWTCSLLQQPCL